MIYSLFFFNIILFYINFIYLHKKSYLVVPWVIVFSTIWIIPVGIIWYFDGARNLEYSFSTYAHMYFPEALSNDILIYITLIFASTFFLFLGFMVADHTIKIKYSTNILYNKNNPLLILFTIWSMVVIIIMKYNGYAWYYIFLPTYGYEGNIYINYIFRTLYLMIPILSLFYVYSINKKKYLYLIVLWGTIVSLSTGQRRNILFFLFFLLYISMYYKYGIFTLRRKLSFKKTFIYFIVGLSSVVVLWIIRVEATNYVIHEQFVYPFEHRSFIDILFGSGATGIPTGYTIYQYVDKNFFNPAYNIIYGIFQVIPRFAWTEKPVGIDTIMQNYYNLKNSPSVFWFGDLLYSFGIYLLPFTSFIFGFIITAMQKIILKHSKRKTIYILISALIFANLFSFFKNGFGMYLAGILTQTLVLMSLYVLTYKINIFRKG